MKTYDWIVVGAGITGAALAYELRKKGYAVLLLEQNPKKTAQGYIEAFLRAGGEINIARVKNLTPTGGVRSTELYYSDNTVVCAGGLSRQLLQSSNIPIKLYFTHAEIIETPPVADVRLRTLVMPANLKRFLLETHSSKQDELWKLPGLELLPPILDAGAVQFKDGSFLFGQVSRALTDPDAPVDSIQSEAALRTEIGKILPILGALPGTWHHCLVSFTHDALPLIGLIPRFEGIYVFWWVQQSPCICTPLGTALRLLGVWRKGRNHP